MYVFNDITGQRFGRLIATHISGRNKSRQLRWTCHCDCGAEIIIDGSSLTRGSVISCGCYKREIARTTQLRHGHNPKKGPQSPTYISWKGMIQRCTNPKSIAFRHYGGRGITVCDRWLIFENFLADMGERPPGKTIDRIEVNGNYEPGNCRWATRKEQMANCRHLTAS